MPPVKVAREEGVLTSIALRLNMTLDAVKGKLAGQARKGARFGREANDGSRPKSDVSNPLPERRKRAIQEHEPRRRACIRVFAATETLDLDG